MIVAVTGTSGFVGLPTVTALEQAGCEVRRIDRSALDDGAGNRLADLLAGADAVVHLAARVHVMQDRAADPRLAFRAANTDLTARLRDAATQAQVKRFVFVSSVKAMGELTVGDEVWTELAVPRPVDPYGESKLAAEGVVLESGGPEGVVLRLPLVYGPRMKGNMLRLFAAVERGRWIPVPSARNERSLAYVENVAAALGFLVVAPNVAGQVYLYAESSPWSTEALVADIAVALGRRARIIRVPAWVLGAAGWAGSRLGLAVINESVVQRLTSSLRIDAAKLRDAGFAAPVSAEEGMLRTARWYRTPVE